MVDREGESAYLLVSVHEEDHPEYGEGVLLTTWVDITEQKELRDRLEHLAAHDELTGLLNRRALFERSKHALAMCQREDRKAAVLYLDVVGFKQVNEQLGHQGGDQILTAVGERLVQTTRDSDLVARIGGDEFVMLATLLREEEDADQVGRRVMYAFEEPLEASGDSLPLQPAIGAAVFPEDGTDIDTLLHRADRALWGQDRNKPSGVRRCRAVPQTERMPSWNVPEELQRALQTGGELFPLYQPVISAADGEIVGMEALVRWNHPEHGLLAPGTFIPEAEATGLVRQLDREVGRSAVQQITDWIRRDLSLDWMAVNLSAQTLSEPECVEWMARVLEDHPELTPKRMVVEVTEHTAMREVARSQVLHRLDAEVGLSISIDDFGIGYSSLLYLRRFPADFLKIDREFVQDIQDSSPDQKVVRGIIALGEAFDMKLIAEGVETDGEEKWLREAGCDYLQGFRFGRPAAAEEVEEGLLA